MAIDGNARDVLAERRIHIRVEFDPICTGGDYHGVGQVVSFLYRLSRKLQSKTRIARAAWNWLSRNTPRWTAGT